MTTPGDREWMSGDTLDGSDSWTETLSAVDQIEHDFDEAISTLREKLESKLMPDIAAQETKRCLAWVKTKLPMADVIAGIESFEYPGERP